MAPKFTNFHPAATIESEISRNYLEATREFSPNRRHKIAAAASPTRTPAEARARSRDAVAVGGGLGLGAGDAEGYVRWGVGRKTGGKWFVSSSASLPGRVEKNIKENSRATRVPTPTNGQGPRLADPGPRALTAAALVSGAQWYAWRVSALGKFQRSEAERVGRSFTRWLEAPRLLLAHVGRSVRSAVYGAASSPVSGRSCWKGRHHLKKKKGRQPWKICGNGASFWTQSTEGAPIGRLKRSGRSSPLRPAQSIPAMGSARLRFFFFFFFSVQFGF
jgi:hypothetical protein